MRLLVELLAKQGHLDELRARADTGEWQAGFRLATLLAESGRVDELRTRMESGRLP